MKQFLLILILVRVTQILKICFSSAKFIETYLMGFWKKPYYLLQSNYVQYGVIGKSTNIPLWSFLNNE